MSAAYPKAVRQFGLAALEARPQSPPRPTAPGQDRGQRLSRRVVVRLWVPTTAIFALLAPAPLLLAPLARLAPAPFRPANPYLAVVALGRLLMSLGGTRVDVDTPDALVRIRLF